MDNDHSTKPRNRRRRRAAPASGGHVLDQLFLLIGSRKEDDPDLSYTARLLKRGRGQIAKKLGEEVVEAMIEAIRDDRVRLVEESVDVLYHLVALWAAMDIEPDRVWRELARRGGRSGGKS